MWASSSASRACAARRSPTTCCATSSCAPTPRGGSPSSALPPRLHVRPDQPEAVAELVVAYRTLQCPELLANGAPGIHFYTLNKSHSTRAILGAVRAMAPWRQRVAA